MCQKNVPSAMRFRPSSSSAAAAHRVLPPGGRVAVFDGVEALVADLDLGLGDRRVDVRHVARPCSATSLSQRSLRVGYKLGVRFVPESFDVPGGLTTDEFRLVPLGAEHNKSDYAAWSSSVDHIHATPGFEKRSWPPRDGMPLEQNREELEEHARDFAERRGFTYSVLAPDRDEVLGCVYIYPARDADHDADVRSWVRSTDAHLDAPLHDAVTGWLADRWPFERVAYASRSSR
jgi:hypothetical protein